VNIYVGNLASGTSERKLRKTFEMYGKVGNITIDGQSPDSPVCGFCFVAMPFDEQASRAVRELNGKMMNGNSLIIKESGLSV